MRTSAKTLNHLVFSAMATPLPMFRFLRGKEKTERRSAGFLVVCSVCLSPPCIIPNSSRLFVKIGVLGVRKQKTLRNSTAWFSPQGTPIPTASSRMSWQWTIKSGFQRRVCRTAWFTQKTGRARVLPLGGSCREVPSGASEVLQILLSCILSWVSRCDVPLLPSRCVKDEGQFRRLQGPLALRGFEFPFFL